MCNKPYDTVSKRIAKEVGERINLEWNRFSFPAWFGDDNLLDFTGLDVIHLNLDIFTQRSINNKLFFADAVYFGK